MPKKVNADTGQTSFNGYIINLQYLTITLTEILKIRNM
jgi:hypothetical protein